jgi:putative membrane-bound dehydrogenase-like protein
MSPASQFLTKCSAAAAVGACFLTVSHAQLHPAGQNVAPAPANAAPPPASGNGAGQAGKPLFASAVISRETPGHSVEIDVPLAGAKKLYLVVTDGGDGFTADWSNWMEPRLLTDAGERKLTELRWASATSEWGRVSIDKNASGQPMKVAGKPVAWGIGTHANSVIEYDLPTGAKAFKARGGLDNGGTDQGSGSTVKFEVWTTPPGRSPARQGGGGGAKPPEEARLALDVVDGCDVATFAAEPLLLSPSSIDIDARGRVWVAEIVNYRGHAGKRPAGDRILILEDLNGDGVAEKQTVFYEGKDCVSPHGVTVLGNRVIVSAGDHVMLLTDENNDDKADRSEVIFTGIHGVQHDHGIHAFHFGPDGKLYFNFGNEGFELKDGKGQPITDAAGNVIACNRKPYQQGCIFRCDPDFTNLETVAWNFRNNWECNVDSYGAVWQSDNDDDGNKGVRINFVMEYGNYGYKDEMTGDHWQRGDAKTDLDVQIAHWHLLDPGVVPNLLQTGGGSPTGICIYEGDLLPKAFHGQMIHCDAGPNIVRSYPVVADGAGYKAEIKDILLGARDKWFRPSDVSVAPDGSLFVADWYDPGVGGHAMGDLDRGRIYRVAPPDKLPSYRISPPDLATAAGAARALCSPNEATRHLAWNALQKMGEKAVQPLEELTKSGNQVFRARAFWALGKMPGRGEAVVQRAVKDSNPDIRMLGLRLARQLKRDLLPIVGGLVKDSSAQVRRECSIALRHIRSAESAKLWAELAAQHDGKDRWYLEALGIGANLHWDECLDAYLAARPNPAQSPQGRDIIWISRAARTPSLLAAIVKDPAVPSAEKFRCLRAFDFQTAEDDKQKALRSLLVD